MAPKFLLQSTANLTGQVTAELNALNGFNSTNIRFTVNIREIVERLVITRAGTFPFEQGRVFQLEKASSTANGADVQGAVYTMQANNLRNANGVIVANITGRGEELGRVICRGGLVENG